MMLDWLGEQRGVDSLREAARAIDATLAGLPREPATRTADLGGPLGTRAFAAAACADLAGGGKRAA